MARKRSTKQPKATTTVPAIYTMELYLEDLEAIVKELVKTEAANAAYNVTAADRFAEFHKGIRMTRALLLDDEIEPGSVTADRRVEAEKRLIALHHRAESRIRELLTEKQNRRPGCASGGSSATAKTKAGR